MVLKFEPSSTCTYLVLGPRYHIADIIIEEFLRVTNGKLRLALFLEVILPFVRIFENYTDDAVFNRISQSAILALIKQFPVSGGEGDHPLNQSLLETVQHEIFALASSEKTIERNRAKLYALHKEFQRATQKKFIEELPQIKEDEPEVVSKPSKKQQAPKQSSEVASKSAEKQQAPKLAARKRVRDLNHSVDASDSKTSNEEQVSKKPAPSREEDFIPAGKYGGSKAGYVFKKDSKGLGYYRDTFRASVFPSEDKAKKTVRFGKPKAKAYTDSVNSLKRSPVDLKSTPSRSSLKDTIPKHQKNHRS